MIRLLIFTFLVSIGAAACGNTSQDNLPADYVRIADKDDVPTLDPAHGYDTASWQFEDLLFETLLDYGANGELEPELAESWEVSSDGLTYTFRLRGDARFSNGREVAANDVRFGIVRVVNPATQSPGAEFFRDIVGAESCTKDSCEVRGLEVPGPNRLRIELRHPDPLFLHKLAMPFASAIPAEVVREKGDDFGRSPVGSGPFRLREWQAGQRLVLERRDDVPRVAPAAGIVRLVGVDDDLAWLKFRRGQIDIAGIPPAEFTLVIQDPGYADQIRHVTALRTQYLGMNCRQHPFDDRRVRRALNHAVNKEKLLRLLNDRGVVARGIVPPNMPDFTSQAEGYAFDPGRARTLLREAGLEGGFESTLWIRNDDNSLRLAQSIQQDLARIGVQIRLKPVAWGPFLEAVKSAEKVPMFLLGWEADFPDASNFLEVLLHSKQIGTNNNTNYRNPDVDRLLDLAARSIDQAERRRLLQEVERVAVSDAPWVFLYHPVTFKIASRRVRDLTLDPLRPDRLGRVWVDVGLQP